MERAHLFSPPPLQSSSPASMEPGHREKISGSYHLVAIPFPGRGHINPMMNLGRLLASKGLLVSFVVTEEWLGLLTSAAPPLPPNLRLRSIPNVLPSERIRGNDFSGFVRAVQSKMEAPVEALVGELWPPADSILTDSNLLWAADIAKRMSIPVLSLWTQSVAAFLALYICSKMDDGGQLPADFSDGGNEPLSYLPRHSIRHLSGLEPNASSLQLPRSLLQNFWIPSSQSLLFTSFDELESQAIAILSSHLPIPITSLGPCIPHMTLNTAARTNDTSSYFKWLDSQPGSSVLYVSLGSFLPLTGPQMDEMEAGLQDSGVRFLWVIREAPETMKESCKGLGLVVRWCDQLRVLCHPSIGGFLTHCGWNSTLEGIFAGVPMLTFPLFWDQCPNSKMVVDDWKVGLRLKDVEAEDWIVEKEVITRVVKDFMNLDTEESKVMKRRVAELQYKCRKALDEGGSSSINLNALVEEMVSKRKAMGA